MNKLVSIIIPVYNVEKYIEKCVNSVLNQTYKNIEVIIVNDGTKDKSIDIVNSIKDSRIVIINQENSGVSVARNNGLCKSKGYYVVFVDADDYLSEDYIDYMVSLIDKDDCDFSYSLNCFQTMDEHQPVDKPRIIKTNESVGILLSGRVVVGCWNKIYKKQFLNENNLFFRDDLFYGEGLNFIIRCSLAAKKICIGDRKVYYYRNNNTNSATKKYNINKIYNGEKSLKIIEGLIDLNDDYVKSMYVTHLSMFYCGAIANIIENKKKKQYINDYKKWKNYLKNNLLYIILNKYISTYRKMIVISTIFFPNFTSYLNRKKNKNKINKSV